MDLFSLSTPSNYVAPPQTILSAARAKGLEVSATFARRNKGIFMDMTFHNKTMMAMSGFAIQFNKNSFGLAPGAPLSVNSPIQPGSSASTSLSIVTTGPVMKMEPLLKVQMAMKNDIDVFYFECVVPAYVLFVEEGNMERNLFPQRWREIPDDRERQFTLDGTNKTQEQIEEALNANNIFVVATRQGGDGEHLIYTSVKFTNGIWVLGELRLPAAALAGPAAPTLALKTQTLAATQEVLAAVKTILGN